MKIAVDVMGGDNAPLETVEGALIYAEKNPSVQVLLVGKEDKINEIISKKDNKPKNIEIINATEVIEGEDHPVSAIRKKKDSSMAVALKLLKEKKADAVVSAGNTGALLAGSIFITGRIKGVERPAITGLYPTKKGASVILDIGANADVQPEHLLTFAKMGTLYAKLALKKENPTVGLINIGTEPQKGNQLVKEAYNLFKDCDDINFKGNVESKEIPAGVADVLVCDGFTGNIILKLTEGIITELIGKLKTAMLSDFKSKMGAMFLKDSLKKMKNSFNYEEIGGAILLGIDGTVIKAHGSSKRSSFSNAIKRAEEFCNAKVVQSITEMISEGK